MNVNPDNVATPIAASLGDLVTLAILAYTSSAIHELNLVDDIWLNEQTLDSLDNVTLDVLQSNGINLGVISSITVLVLYYVAVAPTCFLRAKQNNETETVLLEGWTPGND